MAKHRGQRSEQKHGRPKAQSSKVMKPNPKQKKLSRKPGQAQQQHDIMPFGRYDRILLIGEGDFSFACSLIKHHGCRHVTATCFDSEEQLAQKYPQAKEAIQYLQENGQRVIYSVDATKLSQRDIKRPPLPPVIGSADSPDPDNEEAADDDENEADNGSPQAGVNNESAPRGPRGWDVIAFNFPHVGGKSTDVNRQVRYNQALLVSYFERAQHLLTPPCPEHPAGGVILTTLFEGEPYTLWNVKDLGRHVGMRSARSWKFDWSTYPGYSHARTLGNIDGGGGWKGEERAARTYAFISKDAPSDIGLFERGERAALKRKGHVSSDDEDD